MEKNILVLDPAGMAPSIVQTLESQLDCKVSMARELADTTNYMKEIHFNIAIINPYPEHQKLRMSYVGFIKKRLKRRKIPVMIFSRAGIEKLAEKNEAYLILGRDYQAYLRKPSPLDVIVEEVRKLLVYSK